MALLKCKECGHEISDEAKACPNCGKPQKNKPLSTSLSKQITIYFVSLFLPPFGLWYAWKYLEKGDQELRKIGLTAVVLTIISIVASIWFTVALINLVNQSLNSINLDNFQ
ncbi:MAG: zinc ribbon domain-containing protein [Candidatus Nealsonbacteria bacterium]|nr:zinc ribbon domain-containing protein [Candidatus Nealsonbacteria bacterium]